ncbi:MAG: M3 family oligoendopeptidase [Anaerolineales bacterium]|nr:M3 family oligoendopeptidase [Anaerolineales bacterium]
MKPPAFKVFMTQNWEGIQPLYQQLEDIELTEESLDLWMEGWSDLRKLVDERYARLELATELDTTDEEKEKQYHDFLEHVYPAIKTADQSLKEKLLGSGLIPQRMELALKKMQAEADLFCEDNLPLMTEESKLGTQYSKILGAQTVQWQEEELTLVQVKSALLTTDRAVRKELWELLSQRQLEDREAINGLWEKFMGIRGKLASNAGFPDYRAFRWQQQLRLDYSPKESRQFINAVKEVAVPAATRVYGRYQSRMGIDQVRPWDLLDNQTTFSLPAIQVFKTEEEFTTQVGNIFNCLDPVLGGYFKSMRENDLLDLMNRKGKGPGAFCTEFATLGVPFIFMNAVGRGSDLQVLFHESGHAFHVFELTDLPYHHQRWSGLEFAEVASIAMELLAEPYLSEDQGGFLSPEDAARTRLLNLEGQLLFWPYMAVVVAFQHWVYENHSLAGNPDACDGKWSELIDFYMPGINWDGYEDVKMTGWHRKLHIHQAPFYYIEYGLASLAAFQIWENAQKDQSKALQNYRQSLALGGTATLPELYVAAGANLSFDSDTLGSAIQLIEKTLAELETQLA